MFSTKYVTTDCALTLFSVIFSKTSFSNYIQPKKIENQYTQISLQSTTSSLNEKRAEQILYKDQRSLGENGKNLGGLTTYINVQKATEKLFPNRDKLRTSKRLPGTFRSRISFLLN